MKSKVGFLRGVDNSPLERLWASCNNSDLLTKGLLFNQSKELVDVGKTDLDVGGNNGLFFCSHNMGFGIKESTVGPSLVAADRKQGGVVAEGADVVVEGDEHVAEGDNKEDPDLVGLADQGGCSRRLCCSLLTSARSKKETLSMADGGGNPGTSANKDDLREVLKVDRDAANRTLDKGRAETEGAEGDLLEASSPVAKSLDENLDALARLGRGCRVAVCGVFLLEILVQLRLEAGVGVRDVAGEECKRVELNAAHRRKTDVGPLSGLKGEKLLVGGIKLDDSGVAVGENLLGHHTRTAREEAGVEAPEKVQTPKHAWHNENLPRQAGVAHMIEHEHDSTNREDHVKTVEDLVLVLAAERSEGTDPQEQEGTQGDDASQVFPCLEDLPCLGPRVLGCEVEHHRAHHSMESDQKHQKVSHELVELQQILPARRKEIWEETIWVPAQRKEQERKKIFKDISRDLFKGKQDDGCGDADKNKSRKERETGQTLASSRTARNLTFELIFV